MPTMTELFLAQLDREAASTRKALERVPEGHNEWKPHERSMDLGYLAALVASMPGWIAFMVEQDELDLAAWGESEHHPKPAATREELLAAFESALAAGRRALEGTDDAHLMKPWRFAVAGEVLQEAPRHVMLTDSVFSHLAHHRGQLTVYLRLNEASVPAIYGPSADEGGME